MTANPKSYRPDVDGLRSVAVLLVVAFHAFPKSVRGGFVGVDVFFVISGFLITSIILGQLNQGGFSYLDFYARRVRRIFPALVAVLAAVYAAGWMMLLPEEFGALGMDMFGASIFSANIFDLLDLDYFARNADRHPLLHLWSLGVEEQFYLAWPLLLGGLSGRLRGRLWMALAALAVLSFAANIWWLKSQPAWSFYLPVTRFWELACGGLLAWHARHGGPGGAGSRFQELRSGLGLALILAGGFALSRDSAFPGWWALLPVAGAALAISAPGAWLNRRLLSSRPMVAVGLVSYPLYLWHWPLLSFARIYQGDVPTTGMRWSMVAASAVLAGLTYLAVERPIRTGALRLGPVAALVAVMAVLGGAGMYTSRADGLAFRLPPDIRVVSEAKGDIASAWRIDRCFLKLHQADQFAPECMGTGRRPLVFLWGDSHGGAFYPGLAALAREQGFDLAQYTIGGCPPILDHVQPEVPICRERNDQIFGLIAQSRPEVLILHARWEYDLSLLPRTLERLAALGVGKIIVLGPLPNWSGGLMDATLSYYQHRFHQLIPKYSRYRLIDDSLEERVSTLVKGRSGVDYVSARAILCNAEGCLTRTGDTARDLTAFDYGHLTVGGATYLAHAVAPAIISGLKGR